MMEPPPLRLLLLTVALAFTLVLTGSANAQQQAPRAQAPAAGPAVPAVPQPPVAQERLPAPPTPPTEVRVISTPDADPASRPEIRLERDLAAQEGMAVAGYLVAVFTALQALLTAGGIWLLWRTLKATRNAVTEAQKATAAAEAAVEVTRDAAQRQLRAYVNVSKAGFRPGPPMVDVDIRNSGQTPAYNLRHWTTVGIGPLDLGVFPEPKSEIAPAVLGAIGVMSTATQPTQGGQDVMGILREGRNTLYAWGAVTYDDAFGKVRRTSYRLKWVSDGMGGGLLVPCAEGNDAN